MWAQPGSSPSGLTWGHLWWQEWRLFVELTCSVAPNSTSYVLKAKNMAETLIDHFIRLPASK